MDTTEKISVIIPTYNRANLIERSVRSVLDQTYDNLEVIVVDDCSTDNTLEVVESIDDSRVHFHRLAKNGGAGQARNEGVKLATAELIAFQDSDDAWRPEKLQKQMSYWEKHPDYLMVYCAYESHIPGEAPLRMPYSGMTGDLEGDVFYSLLLRNSIGAPTMLLKKDCFVEIGGFDSSLKCLEDWDFALRFSHEYLVGYVDEILMDVYMTAGSVSSKAGAFFETRCRMIVSYQKELVKAGLFDAVVTEVLIRAEHCGVLNKVKKMLLLMLQNG